MNFVITGTQIWGVRSLSELFTLQFFYLRVVAQDQHSWHVVYLNWNRRKDADYFSSYCSYDKCRGRFWEEEDEDDVKGDVFVNTFTIRSWEVRTSHDQVMAV